MDGGAIPRLSRFIEPIKSCLFIFIVPRKFKQSISTSELSYGVARRCHVDYSVNKEFPDISLVVREVGNPCSCFIISFVSGALVIMHGLVMLILPILHHQDVCIFYLCASMSLFSCLLHPIFG